MCSPITTVLHWNRKKLHRFCWTIYICQIKAASGKTEYPCTPDAWKEGKVLEVSFHWIDKVQLPTLRELVEEILNWRGGVWWFSPRMNDIEEDFLFDRKAEYEAGKMLLNCPTRWSLLFTFGFPIPDTKKCSAMPGRCKCEGNLCMCSPIVRCQVCDQVLTSCDKFMSDQVPS